MKTRRKWVLAAAPPLDGKSCEEIRVGFAGAMRVCRAGSQCSLSVRSGRQRWESAIAEWTFDAIWSATKGQRIRKRRYTWREKRGRIELDIFEGKLEGLILLQARELPEWAAGAREVTDDPLFADDALAQRRPKEVREKLSQPQ